MICIHLFLDNGFAGSIDQLELIIFLQKTDRVSERKGSIRAKYIVQVQIYPFIMSFHNLKLTIYNTLTILNLLFNQPLSKNLMMIMPNRLFKIDSITFYYINELRGTS